MKKTTRIELMLADALESADLSRIREVASLCVDELRKRDRRIVELGVAARDGVATIKWFEEWLNRRDVPVRYDPLHLQNHPPTFTVNYDNKSVERTTRFIETVLENDEFVYDS